MNSGSQSKADDRVVVLYHGPTCADGFAAAFAAWRKFGDRATYIPVNYGDPPPMAKIEPGSALYIVDFSYDRETLIGLAQRCNRVVVLDHHKSAREALAGLEAPGLAITFDLSKSGAVLAWEHFHPGVPVPMLLRFVQDRDIWTWQLPDSREFSASLAIQDRTFEGWDAIASRVEDGPHSEWFSLFIRAGRAILRAQAAHVESLCNRAYPSVVGGYEVPTVNSPIFQSEIGEALCLKYPDSLFAAVWFADADSSIWSLRSRNGFDVAAVAKALGGGGHKAAAGFRRAR